MNARARDVRFIFIALGVFAFLAIATHRWVLVGRIPFAADLFRYFPPWASAGIQPAQHSEIGDSATLFYPWRAFQASSLRQAVLPLWNPLILGGTPFLAEAQSALFYPFHLLYLILPGPVAWTVCLLLNMALAGTFTAWFVRDIGGSRAGAIASGVIFSCCGFVTAFQTFSALADTLIWLPFIFWAVHRLCVSRSISAAGLTAGGFALAILAGHPETAIHVAIAGAAFGLWQCAAGRRDGSARARLIWLSAAGLLTMGLAFVQVVTTFEWTNHITLSPDTRWPARPMYEMLGLVSRDITGNPNSDGLAIPEAAAYVAPLTFLLLPLAFFHPSRRIAVFLALVILVSIQVIWQVGPAHWLIAELPILQRLKNWRVIFLIDFSLAVLGGLGLTVLSQRREMKSVAGKYALLAVGLFIIAVIAAVIALPQTRVATKWYLGPNGTLMFLALGAILILARLRDRINGRMFAGAALLLLTVDMGTYRSFDLPYFRSRDVYPDAPLFRFLKSQDLAEYRVAVLDGTMAANFSMAYGVPEIGGYDINLQLAGDFMEDFSKRDEASINLLSERVANITDRRLDLLNVRYLIATTVNASADTIASRPDRFALVFSEGSVRVFENRNVLPRARFVPAGDKTIEVIPQPQLHLARMKDSNFDAEQTVILSAMPEGLEGAASESDESKAAAAELVSSNPNEYVFNVKRKGSGLLTVGQIFYPGWRAFVDGQEAPVLRANFALLAIPLVQGADVVRLVFEPTSFRVGLGVSVATLLLLTVLIAYARLKTSSMRKGSA